MAKPKIKQFLGLMFMSMGSCNYLRGWNTKLALNRERSRPSKQTEFVGKYLLAYAGLQSCRHRELKADYVSLHNKYGKHSTKSKRKRGKSHRKI